jgi:KaiC/GvpD/RAD55 family RecA-like ATPase
MEDLITGPVPAGSNILVEYDSASQWYAASYAIAAGWLKTGGRVSYCIAIRPPDDFRSQLGKFGLEAQELERDEKLMIYDWYTATLGQKSTEKHRVDSLKVNDLNLYFSKEWMRIPSSPDLLRVTDNISCLDRFNDEKNWVEIFLSRAIPSTSRANSTTIRGIVNGVHSDWAYKTLEASVDGIIDFKLDETTDPARNLIRIRNMRNVGFDGRWHPLKVGENFEVTIER